MTDPLENPDVAVLVTANSGNNKIGPIAATYREVGPTCPPCALIDICYATRGYVKMIMERAADRFDSLESCRGAPLIRHMVAGDCFKKTKHRKPRSIVDRVFLRWLLAWHAQRSQRWTEGWMYTHGARQVAKAGFGPERFKGSGLTVLASCETLNDAQELQRAGWKTARVTEERGDLQPKEVYCPYDLSKHNKTKPDTNCAQCRLCFATEYADLNIVFLQS
jgi:hypothetical protein